MKNIKILLLLLLSAMMLFVMVSIAHADITGDTIEIQYFYPNNVTLYPSVFPSSNPVTGAVTAAGLTMDLFYNQDVTVYPTSVNMVGINTSGSFFVTAAFNGVSITDLTNPSAFTAFSVDPASNVIGFNSSDVSLIGGVLYINYEGLNTPYGSLAQVDLTAPAGVPEPTTLLLLGLGLVGLAGVRRKFKN